MANVVTGAHDFGQSRKAAASGWIGSALEYYDFFIYATAASLVFPQIFFPAGNPTVAIIASLATYGVGYVGAADRRLRARPVRRHPRPKEGAPAVCMFLWGSRRCSSGCCRLMRRPAPWRRRCSWRCVWCRASPWRERFLEQAR